MQYLIRSDTVDPQTIGLWLRSRNRGLGYERPLEALRHEENFARVHAAAEALAAARVPTQGTKTSVRNAGGLLTRESRVKTHP